MAANNFFGYPAPHAAPHAAPAAPQPAAAATPAAAYTPAAPPPPAVPSPAAAPAAVAAYPAPPAPAPPAAVAVAPAAVQPAAAAPAAVAYASQPPAVSSAYRQAPQQAAVVYSAYQPPQNSAATYVAPAGAAPAAAAAAAAAPAVAASATYPTATYATQYPPQQQATAAAAQLYDPSKTTYYPTPQPAAIPVTANYSSMSDPHYQARPVYSANSNVSIVARPATIISAQPRPSYTTYAQSSSTTSYSYGAPPVTISAVATVAAPKHTYAPSQPPAPVSSNMAPVPAVATAPGPAAAAAAAAGPPAPGVGKPLGPGMWSRGKGPPGQLGSGGPPNSSAPRAFKTRMPPKPQQLHYCEVCKISCAGPQTYKEHLEGQKHKKKEAAMKTGSSGPTTRGGNALRCELCDVTCTGSDAYAAHIRGSKHQKVVKLHTKLGKPIPSIDPVLVSKSVGTPGGGGGGGSEEPTPVPKTYPAQSAVQKQAAPFASAAKPQPSFPKINFVHAGRQDPTVKAEPKVATATPAPAGSTTATATTTPGENNTQKILVSSANSATPTEVTIPRLPEEKDVQPVGHDYIEEIKQDGKVVSFNCKLCECRFNDPNAKEMHMKGRRHRLQYKKKVNPDLVVDVKPSLRQRKLAEERAKRTQAKEDFWKRREEEFRMVEEEEKAYWEERRKFEEEHAELFDYSGGFRGRFLGPGCMRPPMMHPGGHPRFGPPPHGMPPHPGGLPGAPPFMFGFPPGPPGPPGMMMRRPDSIDDRHILAKHAEVYPAEEELDEIQRAVATTERALKLVSDKLAEAEEEESLEKKPKVVKVEAAAEEEPKNKEDQSQASRVLKGVMRVGVLAKGLVLKGDREFRLVVLCGEKPTVRLLDRIAALLPGSLAAAHANIKTEGEGENGGGGGGNGGNVRFSVAKALESGGLLVTYSRERGAVESLIVEVSLTSPLMRDETSGPHPEDTLDPDRCLEALAALRHTKWFQARAQGRQSCVLILRVLRDFCRRVPTWTPLRLFSLELLVEKVLASAGMPLSPGDALRRVFEAAAGGILLPDGPGLLDPCEKEPQDAADSLTSQQRGDVTSSAQHALRLIAFRQVHKVLGIEPLPPPKFAAAAAAAAAATAGGGGGGRFARKRRRDESVGEGDVSAEPGEQDEKKDKRGGEEEGEAAGDDDGGGGSGAGEKVEAIKK